jgi:hypothetical protein
VSGHRVAHRRRDAGDGPANDPIPYRAPLRHTHARSNPTRQARWRAARPRRRSRGTTSAVACRAARSRIGATCRASGSASCTAISLRGRPRETARTPPDRRRRTSSVRCLTTWSRALLVRAPRHTRAPYSCDRCGRCLQLRGSRHRQRLLRRPVWRMAQDSRAPPVAPRCRTLRTTSGPSARDVALAHRHRKNPKPSAAP